MFGERQLPRLVAQRIRAPPCEGGGRAFKSRRDVRFILRACMPDAHSAMSFDRAPMAPRPSSCPREQARRQFSGRLRWSGRHPALKTGGHRKVWRSNRQPSANTGAGDRKSPTPSTRGRAAAARRAHNPEDAGASPAPRDQICTDTQAATRPDCRSGAHVLRRFESCSVHHFLEVSVRSSMAEPCVASAQTWVRFLSTAPIATRLGS
jgi:hypothetical protein